MIVRVDGVDLFCCDFCGKRRSLVRALVSAPNRACICDECVELAVEIIAAEQTEGEAKPE